VCEDTSAPYTCAYSPRGADVGRNTLAAVAIDALGQTASGVRAVLVNRFTASKLSLSAARAGGSISATGKLSLPAAARALGCSGTVTVTAKAGSRTLATRTAKVSRGCSYKVKLKATGKLKLTAAFAGNDAVAAKKSSSRTVSAG
jgi:hypothetical protein